jgi:prolyl oligopeptidase
MRLKTPALEPVTDLLHGVLVTDPYRWLENRNSSQTGDWIADQQRRYDTYFSANPNLGPLSEFVRELFDVDIVEQPTRVGSRYFYRRRQKGREQACICTRDRSTGKERLVVDPSPLGPFASVTIHCIADNGDLIAYGLKHGGERAETIHFADVETGLTFVDRLPSGQVRGSAFASDNAGFYYCYEPDASIEHERYHEIRYHRFGESQHLDQVIFSIARTPRSRVTLCSDSLNLGVIFSHDRGSDLVADFYMASRKALQHWHPVFFDRNCPVGLFLRNGRMYIQSFENAPNGRIIEFNPDGSEGCTVVPEWQSPILSLCLVANRIYVSYLADLEPVLHCWSVAGEFLETAPTLKGGSFSALPAYGQTSDSLFCSYESFTQPPSIFEYDDLSRRFTPWAVNDAVSGVGRYRIRKTSYPSKDGTQIPISIVQLDNDDAVGSRPTILTGYGGFGISMTPRFSALVTILLKLGATFALSNIRGGSEFGNSWCEAARGRHRQVAYDDFLAAAEWLYANGVTSPETLGIFGGSNSGLLVGVAMTQRPDLFRAVLCIAPLLDMVRYEQLGRTWKSTEEYGSVELEDEFLALYASSPYHRIDEDVNYPSTLFVTGDKDAQCDPAHVRKMAARLQDRAAQRNSILVDYSFERGHSPVLPMSMRVEALTRRIAFLCIELGIDIPTGRLHDASRA